MASEGSTNTCSDLLPRCQNDLLFPEIRMIEVWSWGVNGWNAYTYTYTQPYIYIYIYGETHTETRVFSYRPVRIAVAAPPSLPSDKLSLKHLSSFPLRKTRNNTSTFNESCTLPRHPNLLNVPTSGMNAVVRRSSIGVLVLLFSELSKVRRARFHVLCLNKKRHTRSCRIHTPFIAVTVNRSYLWRSAFSF